MLALQLVFELFKIVRSFYALLGQFWLWLTIEQQHAPFNK
jgi:hypothetical protein